MPSIIKELRVQIEGGVAPALIQRSTLQVNSCEHISLTVEGVKPAARSDKAAPANEAGKAKPKKADAAKKPVMQATYKLDLSNVKFVAIYDGGQAAGLRIKVGVAKFATLSQPMVFTDRSAAAFNSKPPIVLENESATPKTAVMLVGSDLPKAGRKAAQVNRGSSQGRPKAAKSVRRAAKTPAGPKP
jgi:hypothetical protein